MDRAATASLSPPLSQFQKSIWGASGGVVVSLQKASQQCWYGDHAEAFRGYTGPQKLL